MPMDRDEMLRRHGVTMSSTPFDYTPYGQMPRSHNVEDRRIDPNDPYGPASWNYRMAPEVPDLPPSPPVRDFSGSVPTIEQYLMMMQLMGR